MKHTTFRGGISGLIRLAGTFSKVKSQFSQLSQRGAFLMTKAEEALAVGEVILRREIDIEALGGHYGHFINEVVQKLAEAGVDAGRNCSVKDIVLEYLHNIELHKRHTQNPPVLPVIELRKNGDSVIVAMEGIGTEDDINRMNEIIQGLEGKSNEAIWKEISKRSFAEKPSFETPGAGLGLLTIAALSSRSRLRLKPEGRRGPSRFLLTSSV
jgi:hypothetical protein